MGRLRHPTVGDFAAGSAAPRRRGTSRRFVQVFTPDLLPCASLRSDVPQHLPQPDRPLSVPKSTRNFCLENKLMGTPPDIFRGSRHPAGGRKLFTKGTRARGDRRPSPSSDALTLLPP